MRFYLQDPHIAGLAVIDRERSSLVISSFGDTSEWAVSKLMTVVNALNAATDPRLSSCHRGDVFKAVYPPLAWRVMEYLSMLLDLQSQPQTLQYPLGQPTTPEPSGAIERRSAAGA